MFLKYVTYNLTGERSRLKHGAVPSVFDFKCDTSQESERSRE